jgi:hypothetical protein
MRCRVCCRLLRCGRSVGRRRGRCGCGLGGVGGRGRRIVFGVLDMGAGLRYKGFWGPVVDVLLYLGWGGGCREVEDFVVVLFMGAG